MYEFSKKSLSALGTCDKRLQDLCHLAMKTQIMDFSVIQGYRDKDTQNEYYRNGTSQLMWPDSKHNKSPSLAVDIVPYPTRWDNEELMFELAGVIKGLAHYKRIPIIWGGDWKGFRDLAHFELDV